MNILSSWVWVFDRKGAGSREKSLPHLGGPRGTRPAASGPWKSCNRIAGRFFNQTQHHHHVVRLGLRPSDEFDETRNVAAPQARLQECSPQLSLGKDFAADVSPLEVRERDVGQESRIQPAFSLTSLWVSQPRIDVRRATRRSAGSGPCWEAGRHVGHALEDARPNVLNVHVHQRLQREGSRTVVPDLVRSTRRPGSRSARPVA